MKHNDILSNPAKNKGTAFNQQERKKYQLEGMIPGAEENLERQISRVLEHLAAKPDELEQFIYLQELSDRNQTLFYAVMMRDPARFMPIIYDPTIAKACLTYGQIFRQPQGMYLNKNMKGRMKEVLSHWPEKVRFICISSGGRILGLGDIGLNGAPIPIGKLQLYTACAAIPPQALLPIHFDLGTTNEALRADAHYLGLREAPPDESEIDALMDEFMRAANEVFPGVCVHFEDWKGSDAIRLLERYREQYCVFNDDIQGTASVTLAGLLTALKIKGEKLVDQRILFAGAGSAGTGIAQMLVQAMQHEGLDEEGARAQITLFDVNGVISEQRDDLNQAQQPFAKQLSPKDDFQKIVEQVQPTILIGVSTVGGMFSEHVVKTIYKQCQRPIIFPLSNPTDCAEATPEQLYQWTDGNALVACGVQFDDVTLDDKTFHPGQANNVYIFPALALAVYATRPERITDEMFIAAAHGCADQVSAGQREQSMLYPPQKNILEVEITTAVRIAEHIFSHDAATVKRPKDLRAWIESLLYRPEYADSEK
ncbi:NAD-dependent malic enzyme [Rouxiella sp. T17]|uniref:NAD-dependent malic enzyme n=1 Tax=Rouxiella sp. T17 TaxID=3085684 RepID=UPI002FCB2224